MKIYKLPYINSAYADLSKKELKKLMKCEKTRHKLAEIAIKIIDKR